MATGAAVKKMAAAICFMVVVLFAGQPVMAASAEAGPTGRRLLHHVAIPGPFVWPCPPEPKCQACVSACKDIFCMIKCGEGKSEGSSLFCPTDPKCEACKSRCPRSSVSISLGIRTKCENECAKGRESFHGCPSDAKCEECESGCARAWSTSRNVAAYNACAKGCGMGKGADGFPRCPTDAKCEACADACPICDAGPDCRNECKNKCAGF